jgi:hypothetical protein
LKPQGHVIVSAGLGALFWAKSRDVRTLAISIIFGVLVDLDHLLDYMYAEKRLIFDLKEFMATGYWRKSGRIFLLFHAFEYLPLVYVVWHALKGRKWAVAATAAMSSHVVADHLVNDLKPWGYFILYRLAHRFRAAELMDVALAERMVAERLERRRRAQEGTLTIRERLAGIFI